MIKLDKAKAWNLFIVASMKNNNLSFKNMLFNLGYVDQIMTPCDLQLRRSHQVMLTTV